MTNLQQRRACWCARVIGVLCAGLALTAAPAAAQRLEASFSGGYSFSEGIDTDPRVILGTVFDGVGVDSGGSLNATIGAFVTESLQVEFLWGGQSSRLTAEGPAVTIPVSDMDIHHFMGNVVYHWGAQEAAMRPFLFGGLGATYYRFGALLLDQPPGFGPGRIDNEARFASTWGGGVKYYFLPNVGVKATGRWTPTFIRAQAEGVWCDPWYGCWEYADTEYSNQFEVSGGITVRF